MTETLSGDTGAVKELQEPIWRLGELGDDAPGRPLASGAKEIGCVSTFTTSTGVRHWCVFIDGGGGRLARPVREADVQSARRARVGETPTVTWHSAG